MWGAFGDTVIEAGTIGYVRPTGDLIRFSHLILWAQCFASHSLTTHLLLIFSIDIKIILKQ